MSNTQITTLPDGFFMRPVQYAAKQVYETGIKLTIEEATAVFFAEIDITPTIKSNFTCGIDGVPGTGKSEVGQTIAFLYTSSTEGDIQLVFDLDDIEEVGLPYGSNVIIDEYILPQGQGAILILKEFWNKVSTVRVEGICYTIISPSLPEFKFVNFILYVFAQRGLFGEKERFNVATLSAPWKGKMIEIGEVLIPLHSDEIFRTDYKKRKKKRVAGILKTGGKKFVKRKVNIRESAQQVYDQSVKWKIEITSERVAAGVVSDMIQEELLNGMDTTTAGHVAALARGIAKGTKPKRKPEPEDRVIGSQEFKDWLTLRESHEDLLLSKGVSVRDSKAIAHYDVPSEPKITASAIMDELEITGIRVDSLRKQLRMGRGLLTPSDKETLGEQFIFQACKAHTDFIGQLGRGGRGVADLKGTVDNVNWAVNVKLTFEDRGFRRGLESTPEDAFLPNAFLVLVIPRLLEIRVYKIEGAVTHVNTGKGVLCAPNEVWGIIKKLTKAKPAKKSKEKIKK